MNSLLKPAIFCLGVVLLTASGAASSQYPFRYGFPKPPVHSYNPHLYWSYAAHRPTMDHRTLYRWQDYTGTDIISNLDRGSYGSLSTSARIQGEYGLAVPAEDEVQRSPFPYGW